MGQFLANEGQELGTNSSPSFLGQVILEPYPGASRRYFGGDASSFLEVVKL